MDYIAFLLLLSFVSICIHVLTNCARKRNSKLYKLPPGPFSFPIFGSLFKLGNKPHESLTNLAKIYGPLMTLKLGSLTTIVVSSPNMAKEILNKNDQSFTNRTIVDAVRVHKYHKTSMVWLPVSHDQWRNLRRISNTHMFNTQKLDTKQALRGQKVQELVAYINESCKKCVAVNIGEAAFTTSLNMISNALFSVNLANHKTKSTHDFKDIMRAVMEEVGKPNFVDYFPVLRKLDPQGVRRRMGIHVGKLIELFDGLIEKRLLARESHNSPTSTSNDFLDALLDHSDENASKFGRAYITGLLTDLFVAGTDTTSSTLEWAMAELLHKPDAMAKARLEIQETVDNDKPVEESDIAQLPYLRAVVKETLRLHPPAPFLIPRKAESDIEICGFTIPKDAQVLVNAWAIGRDPSIWANPNSFMPERFLMSEFEFKGQNFEFIPFGSGRRICPGLPLASRVLHLVLASLLHSFDWMLEDGMKAEDMNMDEKFGLTLQKAEPLVAIPVHV